MSKMMSIVVPIFNERENMKLLYDELKVVCEQIGLPYELIFVDDGSTDGSYKILLELKKEDSNVRLVKFRRNYGQTAALSAGFDTAKGDIIVSLDGDLQNDPHDIPMLLARLGEGYDVVCGWRLKRKDSFWKKISSKFSNWFARKLTGVKIHDFGCTLRAYRREAVNDLELYGELHRYIPALIQWRGFNVVEAKVNHRERRHGRSKYGLTRLVKGFLELLLVKFRTSYSASPILLFGVLGLLLTLAGFVMGGYLIIDKYVYGTSLSNRPLIVLVAMLVLFGFQSISIGILADLISRAYYGEKRKPYEIQRID